MASIPIHNETAYTLTDDITQHIIGDAHEHFGEEVRAIRVQSGEDADEEDEDNIFDAEEDDEE